MRVLVVLHDRWSRNAGGARIHFELAEALVRRGHDVEHFDAGAAFPKPPRGRFGTLTRRSFIWPASNFVRRHGAFFDVIDALEGDIPFSAARLGFAGTLVSRSLGDPASFARYRDFERRRWPDRSSSRAAALAWRVRLAEEALYADRAQRAAHVVLKANHDEFGAISDPRIRAKAEVMPFGLHPERALALAPTATASCSSEPRVVAFVGAFTPRKGAHDWPHLARAVLQAEPSTRFLMLGTGIGQEELRARFAECGHAIDVVPSFNSDELPALLHRADLGVFPSYMEGFPFGVLEMLAASLPVVGYRAPGVREAIARATPDLLVPVGDHAAAARVVVDLLRDPVRRSAAAARSLAISTTYRWDAIAERSEQLYAAGRARERSELGPRRM